MTETPQLYVRKSMLAAIFFLPFFLLNLEKYKVVVLFFFIFKLLLFFYFLEI